MITVIFWNIYKNGRVLPHLACLAAGYAADALLLAESPKDLAPAITALNGLRSGTWREETNGGSKIRALTRLGTAGFSHRFTGIAGDTVQSPAAILLAQAEALTKQTKGVLVGKVGSGPPDDNLVVLHFSIVVPALKDYRHRIMVVSHQKDMRYPAMIDAEVFRDLRGAEWDEPPKPGNRADTDEELIELVRKVLRSSYVVSVAQSLIARANDVRSGNAVEPFAPETEPSPEEGSAND